MNRIFYKNRGKCYYNSLNDCIDRSISKSYCSSLKVTTVYIWDYVQLIKWYSLLRRHSDYVYWHGTLIVYGWCYDITVQLTDTVIRLWLKHWQLWYCPSQMCQLSFRIFEGQIIRWQLIFTIDTLQFVYV